MRGGKDPGIGDLSLVEKRNRMPEKVQSYARRILFNTDFLFIRCDKQYNQVAFADILYCMAKNRFCLVVTKHQTFIAGNSLSEIEGHLPSHLFVKIHMSYTVAISRIKWFTRTTLQLHEPGPDFRKGYAHKVDFKIGLTYQSSMRDPLLVVVGRCGGDPYRFAKDLERTKMDVIEEELSEMHQMDGVAVIEERRPSARKKKAIGINTVKNARFTSKGYTAD
ncbi:LytTR family transcriptional regulator [Sediminibacterium roseum]|uniref:LytTR family transcriptional regulator n=1 Tax=Sediminibacterium roseum TaxID=1978412 RepID=A0ABW9ZW01_9BACT|nr:LytTR family DNA-binding domain-containing protein [Sediminibacterium roseum]NCI51333.1 LytTR family transcriptional regulator [Sediminibacterium roseum]